MYQDPTKIRNNVVKIRLNDEEHRLIQALTDYTGEQKASLLRELVLEQASTILDAQFSRPAVVLEGRGSGQFWGQTGT